ncbi:hypothetical protein AHAS_Ahas08G0055100 [Arachis hypogaea]
MAAHASSEIIKYDVFLSFRGTDTRCGFLSHLRKALEDKHIKTYVDYMLREGTEISHSLLAAIEQSEIALIIFSQDYASSKHTSQNNGMQETKWVQIWRDALKEAANLSGLHSPSSSFRNDAEFIDEIVKRVIQKLNQTCQGDLMQGLVGIHEPIGKLESLLCTASEAVSIIGLWGMGGVEHLKKELLSKLLKEEDASPFVTPGGITNFAKKRLNRTKVLVVLDDVNDSDQMEDLCGGHTWFGARSRIIVTTRDKHVLVKADADHIHEVKALNSQF